MPSLLEAAQLEAIEHHPGPANHVSADGTSRDPRPGAVETNADARLPNSRPLPRKLQSLRRAESAATGFNPTRRLVQVRTLKIAIRL